MNSESSNFLLRLLKKMLLGLFLVMWLIGNLLWILIIETLAAITPLDLPEVEYIFRPWDFETSYEKAERLGYYKNPISMFVYSPEKYPDVARKLEIEEARKEAEKYREGWSE